MKKLFSMFLVVAFALSMVGVVFAADNVVKAAPAAPPAAKKQAASASKKKASKAKSHEVKGTILEIYEAGGTFMVKKKRGDVTLKAGEKVKLADLEVGDIVTVKYSGGTATSVKVEKSKSKKSAKKVEAAPAPTAAPAAKPAEKK